MFFRYRRYLEKQVEELKAERDLALTRYHEAIKALVPALRITDRQAGPAAVKGNTTTPVLHSISHEGNQAKCLCGWTAENEDPAILQESIAAHYREGSINPSGRSSWVKAKQTIERKTV